MCDVPSIIIIIIIIDNHQSKRNELVNKWARVGLCKFSSSCYQSTSPRHFQSTQSTGSCTVLWLPSEDQIPHRAVLCLLCDSTPSPALRPSLYPELQKGDDNQSTSIQFPRITFRIQVQYNRPFQMTEYWDRWHDMTCQCYSRLSNVGCPFAFESKYLWNALTTVASFRLALQRKEHKVTRTAMFTQCNSQFPTISQRWE